MNRRRSAFTLLELACVVALVVCVGSFALYSLARQRARTSHVRCINNVKNIGLAYRIFATDNQDRLPFQLSTNDGGTLELSNNIVYQFLILSNELAVPIILGCPARNPRVPIIRDWTNLSAATISYYVGLTAKTTSPESILSGDSNFEINGAPAGSGRIIVASDRPFTYPNNFHTDGRPASIVVSDGSAHYMIGNKVPPYLSRFLSAAGPTNVFLAP